MIAFHPNHDAGRDGILRAIDEAHDVTTRTHLPREEFVGLLRRVDMIVGNSSTGLIEAAAVPVRCVDVGPRQGGRERPPHVITCPGWEDDDIRTAFPRARTEPIPPFEHPYGDGHTGARVCRVLADADEQSHPLTKRCTY